MRILMAAPGHDVFDRRVLRTAEVLSRLGHSVSLFLENGRLGGGQPPVGVTGYDSISVVSLITSAVFPTKTELSQYAVDADVIYVHDSGLYGLRLLKALANINPHARLIFDYHDWCAWEMVHHGRKLSGLQVVLKIILAIGKRIIRHTTFLRPPLDGLLGITDAQIRCYESEFGYREPLVKCAIPNTRVKLDSIHDVDLSSCGPKLSLLWVGNIGAGRAFDDVVALRNAVVRSDNIDLEKTSLLVFGKIWGSYSAPVSGHVDFRGSFSSDRDIMDRLPRHRVIGVFQGWRDPFDTGINQIASPNKVYTYLNLGIPFLVWHELKDFIETAKLPDELVYHTENDFAKKVKYIYENYALMCDRVGRLRDEVCWDEDAIEKLTEFYSRVLEHDTILVNEH